MFMIYFLITDDVNLTLTLFSMTFLLSNDGIFSNAYDNILGTSELLSARFPKPRPKCGNGYFVRLTLI